MRPALAGIQPNAPVAAHGERPGLKVILDGRRAAGQPVVSDLWSVAGWTLQFARLNARQSLPLDQRAGRVHVKVVTGELANIGRQPFAGKFMVRDTAVAADELRAGGGGAVFAVFTETADVADTVRSMAELKIEGPMQDTFQWQRFDAKFGAFTDFFDGLEAYMSPGFHLVDENGAEITYVNLWTAGKGVDLSTHNHGNDPSPTAPAFAEAHWVFNRCAPGAGMYLCDEPGAPRTRLPMRRGQEHGPFFAVDAATGRPMLRPNGAVEYPWHGWQAGGDDGAGQSFDFVAAFETYPGFVLAR